MAITQEGNNMTCMVFGTGDIKMAPTKDAETKEWNNGFVFMSGNPGEIGSYDEHFKIEPIQDMTMPRVYMIFNKIESLDVVIEELQKLREIMAPNTPEDWEEEQHL